MQKVITLNKYDNTLSGKYSGDTDTIIIILSSDDGVFTIMFPDANSSVGKQFLFKNLGSNTVTVNTINGQKIDYSGTFTHAILTKEFFSVTSDGFGTWISLESN